MFIRITVEEAINMKDKIFIDVRSPLEFTKGSIPGAINIPILDNDERVDVGTIYTNKNPEDAKIKGIEYASSKLSSIYNQVFSLTKHHKNIILFCWRGGLRSATLSSFLSVLGVNIYQLEGGYKQYRKHVVEYFNKDRFKHKFIVLHGYTGVGKTEILAQLETFNIPILNLEYLAKNSGSVFGNIVYQDEKPVTQKSFDALLFETLRLNNSKYIIVESEGHRLGRVSLPEGLWDAIIEGKHVLVSTNIENRIKRLVNNYISKISNCDNLLEDAIIHLKKRIGSEKTNKFIFWVEEKRYAEIVKELIIEYYDPLYKYSIDKYNYIMEINYNVVEEVVNKIIKLYYDLENKLI